MKRTICAVAVVCCLVASGCDKEAPAGAEAEPAEAKAANSAAPTAAAPEGEPEFEEHEEEGGEKIPVVKVDFDAAKLKEHLPEGTQLGGFAFTDAFGQNAVAFSRVDEQKEDLTTTVLHVKHIAQNSDHTRVVREYKEVIADCDADIVLEPKFADWSVTDLDSDGIGEATFAYTASCTSDISPNQHKVLVTEGGQKYALRGNTLVRVAPGEEIGGEYKADPMDPPFLAHAKIVWDETSKGYGFEK